MLLLRIRKSFDDVVSRDNTQLTRLAQIRNTLPVITQEDVRQTAIEIGFGKVGIQFDSLIIIRQCRTIVFQHGQYVTAVIIAVHKIGSQLDDMVQVIFHMS